MHFEVLVEDRSGSIVVDNVLRAVLGGNGDNHSWRTHSYKGLGRLPRGLHGQSDPSSRILLQQLPRIMRGYGNSLSRDSSAMVVVVDLDDRDCCLPMPCTRAGRPRSRGPAGRPPGRRSANGPRRSVR